MGRGNGSGITDTLILRSVFNPLTASGRGGIDAGAGAGRGALTGMWNLNTARFN